MLTKQRMFLLSALFSFHTYAHSVSATPHALDEKKPKRAASNTSFFANYLYWHTSEETSSSWGYIPELPNITAPNIYFDWSPGVQLGLSYDLNNALDIEFDWTYFSTEAQSSAAADINQNLFPQFFNGFTTLTPFTSGKIKWQLAMNIFNLELGHQFNWKNSFTTRPFIGVKGGTIDQNINSNWQYQRELFSIFPINYAATEKLKNNFSGVGPSLGLDNQWKIYKGLNLRGDFSMAWLWGNWNIQDNYTGPSLAGFQLATTIHSGSTSSLGTLMLRYFAGLDWTYEAQALVTIKVGYEMQLWMNQLRIPVFQQVPVHGDLTLQGGTCGILIKF